jgi:hypothetical protein
MNTERYYYVTIHLTNGGIESIEISLNEEESACYETFQQKIQEYDDNHTSWETMGLYSKGHIISWSLIE